MKKAKSEAGIKPGMNHHGLAHDESRNHVDGTTCYTGNTVADNELIQFVRSYSEPIELKEAARDLARLGKYGAAWPRASIASWETRLRELAKLGELVREGQLLSAPPLPIEATLPKASPEETPLLDYINQHEGIPMK